MAESSTNVSQARALRAGASALKRLIRQIGEVTSKQYEESGWMGDDYDGDDDPRDYVLLAGLVEGSLLRNFVNAGPKHREGFLRALTDLISTNTDGFLPIFDAWDPIRNTEPAFKATQATSHLIQRAAT